MLARTLTKALASDPDFEFEFFLGEKLGMTVAQLRVDMGNDEFAHWAMYYGRKAQRNELAQKGAK
jgi:hypothetical protein